MLLRFSKSHSWLTYTPYKYMKTEIMNSMFLETVSPEELLEVIKDLKHSAVGYDELEAQHIKSSSSIIIQPLLHICNFHLHLDFSQMPWRLPKLFLCLNPEII